MAVHMLIARSLASSLLLLLLVGPALAGTPYDGVWNVTVETRAGSCERSAQYRLTVLDGKISGPADIAGTVAHEGMVKVTLNGAYAFGQLDGKIGPVNGTQHRRASRVAVTGKRRKNSIQGRMPPVRLCKFGRCPVSDKGPGAC